MCLESSTYIYHTTQPCHSSGRGHLFTQRPVPSVSFPWTNDRRLFPQSSTHCWDAGRDVCTEAGEARQGIRVGPTQTVLHSGPRRPGRRFPNGGAEGRHLAKSGDTFDCHYWEEARQVAKHPTMHSTAHTQENNSKKIWPTMSVTAKVEEPPARA